MARTQARSLGVSPASRGTARVADTELMRSAHSTPHALFPPSSPPLAGSRRALARGGVIAGAAGAGSGAGSEIYDEGGWSVIWLFLTVAEFLLFYHCAFVSFMPFTRLNVMLLTIESMLKNDILVYLVVFFFLLIAFAARGRACVRSVWFAVNARPFKPESVLICRCSPSETTTKR